MAEQADKPSVEGLSDWLREKAYGDEFGTVLGDKLSGWADVVERLASQSAAPEWQVIWTALDETAKQIHSEEARNNVREFLARAWHHQVVPALAANRRQSAARSFSDFIRKATPQEKEALYSDVMGRAAARQQDTVDAAPPSTVLLEVLEALEVATTGLGWYRDMCPQFTDESDEEAGAQIDAAIAKLRTWMGADHG